MKKIKLLASLTAVGALSAMFAAASYATEYTANASYAAGTTDTTATVTVSGLDNYTADNTVGDYTIVILNADVENPTDENIVYVMQGTKTEVSTAKFANLPVGENDATYYVRVGGSSTGIAKASFTVKGTGTSTTDPDPDPNNPYANSTLAVGDVNGSGEVDDNDLTGLVYHIAGVDGYVIESGENLAAADVNDTGEVDDNDLTKLVYYLADSEVNAFPYALVKDKQNNKDL